MKRETVVRGVVASFVAVAIAGVAGGAAVGAASQRSESVVYAVYDGQGTAAQVFKTIQNGQYATGERIESYAIVSKDAKGKVKVRDQRSRDGAVGAVIGGIVGMIGGPMGITAGAAAGGSVGYLTGEAIGIPRDRIEYMKTSLTPNRSALIVVLDDRWVQNIERDLNQAQARAVIANQIANPNQSGNPGK